MVRVFATHKALLLSDNVPGMPIEYVYRLDYDVAVSEARKKITEIEHRNAVLERVIARQDAMLVAKEKFDSCN